MSEAMLLRSAPSVTMRRVDGEALRDLCLTFRGSEQTFPFGFETAVFKVAGKMFALSRLGEEPLRVSLKCEPQLAEQLRALHPAITSGYHLNKRHWNTITIDGSLADQMIADMVEDSYDLVVSKLPARRRRALGWQGGQPDASSPGSTRG
jgi:predicted DNA-binding protein (MmcQ/YjbR family)